jgi:hypothetical protein
MLIKNTNPNELLTEFERDKNFCPYNEEELERLKKEAERLREDASCSIAISHNGVRLGYNLSNITDKGVRYEYREHGSIYRISFAYSEERTEYVRFEDWGKIVFFYGIDNSDGSFAWSLDVSRTGDLNQEVRLWIGEELKFKSFKNSQVRTGGYDEKNGKNE